MKTAISISDPLFEAAERLAKSQGKSRSRLYAEALQDCLERHREEDSTRRLNEIFEADPQGAKLDPALRTCSTAPCPRKNDRAAQ